MKCDFCSAPDPAWKYACSDFVLEGTACGSEGAWAACTECAELIEARKWELLAERCLDLFPQIEYFGRGRARKVLRVVHRYFRKNWDGTVERIETVAPTLPVF